MSGQFGIQSEVKVCQCVHDIFIFFGHIFTSVKHSKSIHFNSLQLCVIQLTNPWFCDVHESNAAGRWVVLAVIPLHTGLVIINYKLRTELTRSDRCRPSLTVVFPLEMKVNLIIASGARQDRHRFQSKGEAVHSILLLVFNFRIC